MENDMYDVIIIGGGPAGLTSAIYAARKKLKTLLVSVNMGGQILLTSHIENYPGFRGISGIELAHKMEEQIRDFEAEIMPAKVSTIEKSGDNFEIELAGGEKYKSSTVIMAFGKIPRSLGIPNEDKFLGRGVSTCAICDAPMFRNKDVAIVGGGNSALEAAMLLAKFANKVYLIHRRPEFTGDESTMERIKANPKIEIIMDSVASEIKGDKFVSDLIIENVNTGEKKDLKVDGLFVLIGYETKTEWIKHMVDTNELGEIIVNEKCETSCPGIFAAGDVTNVPYKQMVISAGQGAISALSAYNYIQKQTGGAEMKSDWGSVQKK